MTGIQFVTGEKGRKVAVQIDLKKHGLGKRMLLNIIKHAEYSLDAANGRLVETVGKLSNRSRSIMS